MKIEDILKILADPNARAIIDKVLDLLKANPQLLTILLDRFVPKKA